jgi:hypothetical protein
VLPDTSVADLVHLIQLSLEQNEITASLGLLVDHTFFELLKSVDNFKEIAMVKEEPEISAFTFSDNSFNRE